MISSHRFARNLGRELEVTLDDTFMVVISSWSFTSPGSDMTLFFRPMYGSDSVHTDSECKSEAKLTLSSCDRYGPLA